MKRSGQDNDPGSRAGTAESGGPHYRVNITVVIIFLCVREEGWIENKPQLRPCAFGTYPRRRLVFPPVRMGDNTVVIFTPSVRNGTVNYLGKRAYSAIILPLETPLPPVGVRWRGGSARKSPRPFYTPTQYRELNEKGTSYWVARG